MWFGFEDWEGRIIGLGEWNKVGEMVRFGGLGKKDVGKGG